MARQRPSEIKDRHLLKKGAVYARVSSAKQAEESEGSIAYQRGLVEALRDDGFPDVDLFEEYALSGTSTFRRTKYLEMRSLIASGEYSAVAVIDTSRPSRNDIELLGLYEDMRRYDVLLRVGDRYYDLTDDSVWFTRKIEGLLNSADNLKRVRFGSMGRLAMVREGKAVTVPVMGYISDGHGGWLFDPDLLVQEAVRKVFSTFLRERSLPRTVRALRADSVKIPRRRRYDVDWVDPTVPMIARILHSREYIGEYVFPKKKIDETLGVTEEGCQRLRPARPDEQVVIPDHHPPYLTVEEFDEVQRVLEGNRRTPSHSILTDSPKLLQGIVVCGLHKQHVMQGRDMRQRADGSWFHGYGCLGDLLETGTGQCGVVSGARLDRLVVDAVIERIAVPRVKMIREAWRRARLDAAGDERRRRREVERARREADEAEARAQAVPIENELAFKRQHEIWNEKLREVERLEAEGDSRPSLMDRFTEDRWERALQLVQRLRTVFDSPTTSDRDRKELIRMVVDRVVVERSNERVGVRIVWKDGSESTELELKLTPLVQKRMLELEADGHPPAEIAEILNQEGYRTRRDGPFSADTVRKNLQTLKREGRQRLSA